MVGGFGYVRRLTVENIGHFADFNLATIIARLSHARRLSFAVHDFRTIIAVLDDKRVIIAGSSSYRTIIVMSFSYRTIIVMSSSYRTIIVMSSSYRTIIVISSSYCTMIVMSYCYRTMILISDCDLTIIDNISKIAFTTVDLIMYVVWILIYWIRMMVHLGIHTLWWQEYTSVCTSVRYHDN